MKLRDRVTWSSQAGGCHTVKIATIVVVVPPNTLALPLLPALYTSKNVAPLGEPRDHESYWVAYITEYNRDKMGKIINVKRQKWFHALWPKVKDLQLLTGIDIGCHPELINQA